MMLHQVRLFGLLLNKSLIKRKEKRKANCFLTIFPTNSFLRAKKPKIQAGR